MRGFGVETRRIDYRRIVTSAIAVFDGSASDVTLTVSSRP
jgi:hypothetical protein